MSQSELSKEEIILRAVKRAITCVIKDTATEPGVIHPLSDNTIDEMRSCLMLISQREQELAADAGRSMDLRPRYADEPKPRGDVIIPLAKSGLIKDKPKA